MDQAKPSLAVEKIYQICLIALSCVNKRGKHGLYLHIKLDYLKLRVLRRKELTRDLEGLSFKCVGLEIELNQKGVLNPC